MPGSIARVLPFWIGRLAPPSDRDTVAALTGISAEEWREIARAFPELPPDPGPLAARRRARLNRLAGRALSTGRWRIRLEGELSSAEPTVFVTAHIGALQALRYALRARGIPAASVIGPFNEDRSGPVRVDRIFDRRHALDFPHALPSRRPHRLRTALATGSLIVAADLPAGRSYEAPLLGGRVRLDPRPFRLARTAGVLCRGLFLTLPGPRAERRLPSFARPRRIVRAAEIPRTASGKVDRTAVSRWLSAPRAGA